MYDLRLETVTPMFLSGADNRAPELRAASFRGALRFWLRSVLGAQVGNDLDGLRAEERLVFGDTGLASPVVVRVSQARLQTVDRRVLPHSTDRRKMFPKQAFAEGGTFTLTLAPRLGQSVPPGAHHALDLLVGLGGVGNRARRGFGSLQRAEDVPGNGEVLATDLSSHIKTAQHGTTWPSAGLPTYPVLVEPHAIVVVCQQGFNDYEQAMKAFWGTLRRDFGRVERAFGHAMGGRCASPLHLHIARSQAGYHLVLTAFRWTPGPTDHGRPLGDRGWEHVGRFLVQCAGNWQGVYLLGKEDQWAN